MTASSLQLGHFPDRNYRPAAKLVVCLHSCKIRAGGVEKCHFSSGFVCDAVDYLVGFHNFFLRFGYYSYIITAEIGRNRLIWLKYQKKTVDRRSFLSSKLSFCLFSITRELDLALDNSNDGDRKLDTVRNCRRDRCFYK